jgi:hypothetical protein
MNANPAARHTSRIAQLASEVAITHDAFEVFGVHRHSIAPRLVSWPLWASSASRKASPDAGWWGIPTLAFARSVAEWARTQRGVPSADISHALTDALLQQQSQRIGTRQ